MWRLQGELERCEPHALLLVLIAALLACDDPDTRNYQLKRRAAFDMRCPEDRLEVRLIDDRSAGVKGCGQQHVYIEVCRGESDCTWALDSAREGASRAEEP
jgi:hypothetical protein